MPSKSRKRAYIVTGFVLSVVLTYPVVGNVLLSTGMLEQIISKKPEKLKLAWKKAWTLFPGRIHVEGFDLDIHSKKKNRIQVKIDQAVLNLSLFALIDKTVDIQYAEADGLVVMHTKPPKPVEQENSSEAPGKIPDPQSPTTESVSIEENKDSSEGAGNTSDSQSPAAEPASSEEGKASLPKKHKRPWIVQLENVSASNVKRVQFNKFKLIGQGELKDYAMRLVTKGGPLRIDNINLNMKAVSPDPTNIEEKFSQIRAELRMAENIPKQNKGKKLLKFISGRVEVAGDAGSIEFISVLLGDKFNLNVSGAGKLHMLMIAEDGELMHGSELDFDSEYFEIDFLNFHASGNGKIVGRINKDNKDPVSLHTKVSDFTLNRRNAPKPYMEGADLSVELSMQQFLLYEGIKKDAQLYVNFPDSIVRDFTDYNRFIPKHANIQILSGNGRLRGTMYLLGDIGNIYTDLTGKDVVLDVHGNRIRTDLQIVTNLSDGNYGEKSFELTGTYFRMENTQLVTDQETTEDKWWGEIKISKGDLIWHEPMDIDAEMAIKMRDTEPLIALLRDTSKKKSLLDKALTVKDLEGRLGIQTNDQNIILDPILVKSKGLEVISKLDISPKSINGTLYFKLHGIAANFEIKNSKAKFKGLGGKKEVEKKVNMGEADVDEIEMLLQRNPHPSKPISKNLQ